MIKTTNAAPPPITGTSHFGFPGSGAGASINPDPLWPAPDGSRGTAMCLDPLCPPAGLRATGGGWSAMILSFVASTFGEQSEQLTWPSR